MPFECGGLPWIRRREVSFVQTAREIYEKEKLGGGEEEGCVGDEAVEGQGVGE